MLKAGRIKLFVDLILLSARHLSLLLIGLDWCRNPILPPAEITHSFASNLPSPQTNLRKKRDWICWLLRIGIWAKTPAIWVKELSQHEFHLIKFYYLIQMAPSSLSIANKEARTMTSSVRASEFFFNLSLLELNWCKPPLNLNKLNKHKNEVASLNEFELGRGQTSASVWPHYKTKERKKRAALKFINL